MKCERSEYFVLTRELLAQTICECTAQGRPATDWWIKDPGQDMLYFCVFYFILGALMQITHELFPVQDLAAPDVELILQVFDNPVVRKYLRVLGNNLVRDYLLLDASGISGDVLAKHHQFVKGQLAILDALCSIHEVSEINQPE